MTLSVKGLFARLNINDAQHNSYQCYYVECRFAECHYAECRFAECHYAECRYAEWLDANFLHLSNRALSIFISKMTPEIPRKY